MKIGDVVKLKSNNILMTVIRLIGDDHDEEGSGNFFKSMDRRFEMQGFNFGDPTCIWFEGNIMQQAVYKTRDLEIVKLDTNNLDHTIDKSEIAILAPISSEPNLDFELDELDFDFGEIDFELDDNKFDLDNLDLQLDDLDLNFDEIDLDQPIELDLELGLDDDDLNLEDFEIEDLNMEDLNLDFETDFSQESDEIMLDFDL